MLKINFVRLTLVLEQICYILAIKSSAHPRSGRFKVSKLGAFSVNFEFFHFWLLRTIFSMAFIEYVGEVINEPSLPYLRA